jgi:hypothetical protein
MSSGVPEPPRRRFPVWPVVAALAVIITVTVIVALANRGSTVVEADEPAADTSPSSATSPTSSAPAPPPASARPTADRSSVVPSASVPASTTTGEPTVVPTGSTSTTTVALDDAGKLGDGVSVQVAEIENVKGTAQGPGEVAGPALRITVEVDNGGDTPLALDAALVNLYYGEDRTPASTLSGPGVDPFPAAIRPGRSGSGRFVFAVPRKGRNPLTVEFSYTTEAPTVIFRGTP